MKSIPCHLHMGQNVSMIWLNTDAHNGSVHWSVQQETEHRELNCTGLTDAKRESVGALVCILSREHILSAKAWPNNVYSTGLTNTSRRSVGALVLLFTREHALSSSNIFTIS